MNFRLQLPARFHKSPAGKQLPATLVALEIPGADSHYFYAGTEFLFAAELSVNGFTIVDCHAVFDRQTLVACHFPKPVALLHYPLQGMEHLLAGKLQYPLPPGHQALCCSESRKPVRLRASAGTHHFLQVYFPLSLLQKLAADSTLYDGCNHPAPDPSVLLNAGKKVRSALATLLATVKRQPFQGFYLNNRCMFLLQQYLKAYELSRQQQQWITRKQLMVTEMQAYIEQHLSAPPALLSRARLAKKTGLSLYAFCRLFRKTFGTSPGTFIENKRMAKALELLGEGQLTIAEVSLATGYADLSSFSRAFKKFFHRTPSSFRGS